MISICIEDYSTQIVYRLHQSTSYDQIASLVDNIARCHTQNLCQIFFQDHQKIYTDQFYVCIEEEKSHQINILKKYNL